MSRPDLRKSVEELYLPKQLLGPILELGEIPEPTAALLGVGFADVVDYTSLARFLSITENRILLDGLYAVFFHILEKHGGYLNKIEGDSIMFHFGGPLDAICCALPEKQKTVHIASALFHNCVELQRAVVLFNRASDRLLERNGMDECSREMIRRSFKLIRKMRTMEDVSPRINALFQIKIRIGAAMGEVLIGNFGPEGAKQWDVLGFPIIEAKRMEQTAPMGGLRISESYYKVLEKGGILRRYYSRFKREAIALKSVNKDIVPEELFRFSHVALEGKYDAHFPTYSIQVDPNLPESISKQVELLIKSGLKAHLDLAIELIKYYRGNRFVISRIEDFCEARGINLRKPQLIRLLLPSRYERMITSMKGKEELLAKKIDERYSIYDMFLVLDKIQGEEKRTKQRESSIREKTEAEELLLEEVDEGGREAPPPADQYLRLQKRTLETHLVKGNKQLVKNFYFHNYLFPLFFAHIRIGFLEYQLTHKKHIHHPFNGAGGQKKM